MPSDSAATDTLSGKETLSLMERVGRRIPDPVIIFIVLSVVFSILSLFLGGLQFSTPGAGGVMVEHEIRNMLNAEGIRWMFDNALLQNWLAFGHGVLGVILIVMLGVGVAERSGLLAALIKKVGLRINDRLLPMLLVFLGIMSSLASDAGYLILVPLAGLLYGGLGKNPLIGMAAAFAGVSAGFSANLIPATPIDVVIGANAQIFAETQGVPFERADGTPLTPATMHYWFVFVSTFLLSIIGAFITIRYVTPRLEKKAFTLPDNMSSEMSRESFNLSRKEERGLKFALLGLIIALALITWLILGPLAPYSNEQGKVITPYLNNVILLITLVFIITGIFYGLITESFASLQDILTAMVKQMDAMGYILVLTFFCYNFLSMLGYSGMGTWITYLGAKFLQLLGLDAFPVLLIIGFVITTAVINLFVGGMTAKWMLLGPIFVPMLYQVNNAMTPDLVAAAFRVADSSTNVITPMMTYAGVVLAFMRKYSKNFSMGDLIGVMMPYSIAFLMMWTALLVVFFSFDIPLGF